MQVHIHLPGVGREIRDGRVKQMAPSPRAELGLYTSMKNKHWCIAENAISGVKSAICNEPHATSRKFLGDVRRIRVAVHIIVDRWVDECWELVHLLSMLWGGEDGDTSTSGEVMAGVNAKGLLCVFRGNALWSADPILLAECGIRAQNVRQNLVRRLVAQSVQQAI